MNNQRRQTMQSSGQSAIPMPSTASRLTASHRSSMAPQATTSSHLRQSLAPGASTGARNSRPSTLHATSSSSSLHALGESQGSQGSQPFSQGHGGMPAPPQTATRNNMYNSHLGSASVTRHGTMNRAPLDYPQSERRANTFRRSTIGPAATQTPVGVSGPLSSQHRLAKDPREGVVRHAEFKKKCAADICAFLLARTFTLPNNAGPPTEKHLLQPTGAQFYAFFRFLITQVDPNLRASTATLGEADVLPTLQTIGYPFFKSITKSHLQSIGSQQSWPNMLAMLHWLVDLVEQRERAFEQAEGCQIPAPDPELPHEDLVFAAWFDFATQNYYDFLATPEGEPFIPTAEELDLFHGHLENGRDTLRASVRQKEEEHALLQKEYDALMATPDPLIAKEEQLAACESDFGKLEKYLKDMQDRIDGRDNAEKHLITKKHAMEQDRDQAKKTIELLGRTIAAQGMTPSEITHLNSEKTQLQAAQRLWNERQTAKLEATMGLEITLQKRFDRANALATLYTTKAKHLALLPQAPEGFEHIDFEQELNGAAENPVPDCLSMVKPALVELRQRAKAECVGTEGRDVALEEKITRMREANAELSEQKEADEVELEQAERENLELKEATSAEFVTVNQEFDRLGSTVHSISSTLNHPLAAAEARYDQRVLERTQMAEDADRIRRESREALESALDEIISYKQHMMEQTEILLQLVDAREE